MANFGDIPTNTELSAYQSVRRNSLDTAFEAFVPIDASTALWKRIGTTLYPQTAEDRVTISAPTTQLRLTDSDDSLSFDFNINAGAFYIKPTLGTAPFTISTNNTVASMLQLASDRVNINTGVYVDNISEYTTDAGIVISPVNYIDFKLDSTPTHQEGRLHWNADDGTLELGMPGGVVQAQLAQELLVRVRNASGADMTNGQIIYNTGSSGSRPTVELASAASTYPATQYGILTEDIDNNSDGYVTLTGIVRGLDTSSWPEGTSLYLSEITPGALTSTKPIAPNHKVWVAVVINQHVSEGMIYFKPATPMNIHDLSDVNGTTPDATNNLMLWDDVNGYWNAGSIGDISYWDRDGVILTPATAGDSVSIDPTARYRWDEGSETSIGRVYVPGVLDIMEFRVGGLTVMDLSSYQYKVTLHGDVEIRDILTVNTISAWTGGAITINDNISLPDVDADETEEYVVTIDDTTGLLSKRLITGLGSYMVYPDAGIAISTGTGWGTSVIDNSINWNTAYDHTNINSGNPHQVTWAELQGTQPPPISHSHIIADISDFTDNSSDWDTAFSWGDHDGLYEPLLGDPAVDGYILSSTVLGVRSWIPLSDFNTTAVPDIAVNQTEDIIVGDITEDLGIIIRYIIKRGSTFRQGTIELLNTTNLTAGLRVTNNDFGNGDPGVRLDGIISTNDIVLQLIVDNSSVNLVDFRYIKMTITGSISQDLTPPAIPTSFIVIPANGQNQLNWADNADGDLAGYNVYRADSTGGPYVKLNTTGLVLVSDYIDSDVSNYQTYYYVVTAVDTSTNESNYSTEQSGQPYIVGNFHVDPLGSDTNDGSTPDDAWATLSKVESEIALGNLDGETVMLVDDAVWNESLDFAGHDIIVLTNYGNGTNIPKISGLTEVTGTWTDQTGNIWSRDITSLSPGDVRWLLIDGVDMDMAKSIIRWADSSGSGYFVDDDLAGTTGDYNSSEVVMRTSNYTWEVRNCTTYVVTGVSGRVNLDSPTSYHLTQLNANGGQGGYYFQNSLKILTDNAIQGEWCLVGNILYMYSTTEPSTLGTIEVSTLDSLIDIDGSTNIEIDSIAFEYANQYGIYGNASHYKDIHHCTFDNINWAIFDLLAETDPSITFNTFNDCHNGIYLWTATNPTVEDNRLYNTGLELGRCGFISSSSAYWGHDGINLSHINGGSIQRNHVITTGYCGIKTPDPSNDPVIKNNYVKNANQTLNDGGAYYTWEENTSVRLGGLYDDNIAVFDSYSNDNFKLGRRNQSGSWGTDGVITNWDGDYSSIGYYKDGYMNGVKYNNNFAFGCTHLYYANGPTGCEWTNNIGASPRHWAVDRFVTPMRLNGYPVALCEDMVVTGNTLIAFHRATFPYWQRVGLFDIESIQTGNNNVFDNNDWMQPSGIWYSSNHSVCFVYDVAYPDNDKDITAWRADNANHLGHDQSNTMTMDLSGITDPEEFLWYAINPTMTDAVAVSFPTSYRYYNTQGIRVLSDTLDAYKGKVYFRTIDEPLPTFTNVGISGSFITGQTHNASVTFDSSEITNAQGTHLYQWYICSDSNIRSRDPISGATNANFVPTEILGFDGTKYLALGSTPVVTAGGNSTLLKGVEKFSSPALVSIGLDFYLRDDGNDLLAGTSPATAWQTMTKLSDEFNSNNIPAGSVVGLERGSVFRVNMLDTYGRSGTSGNEIVIRDYGSGDRPIIKGSKILSGTWTEETGLGTNIWSFTDATLAVDVRNLYLGGVRQEMGKTIEQFFSGEGVIENDINISFHNLDPDEIRDASSRFLTTGLVAGDEIVIEGDGNNNGTYVISTITAGTIVLTGSAALSDESAGNSITIRSRRVFVDNVRAGSNDDWNGGEIALRSSQWTEDVLTIDDYIASTGAFHTTINSSYLMLSSVTSTHRYILQNHWRTLLAAYSPSAGNWAYDSATNKIYFYSTVNPSTLATIEVSAVEHLVDLNGSDYIKFQDVDFEDSNSVAILAINSSNIEFNLCRFENDTRAIDFWGNGVTQEGNRVTNSDFIDITQNGVLYSNQNDVYFVDNTLTRIGIIIGSKLGVSESVPYSVNWAHNGLEIQDINGTGNTITVQYNKIDSVGYCGIKVARTENQGFTVRDNWVKDALYTLSDGGGIYFVSNFSANGNTRLVTNNHLEFSFNNSLTLYVGSYKAHGIYLDRENYDLDVDGNTVMGYLIGINNSYADNTDNMMQNNIVWAGPTAVGDSINTRPMAYSGSVYLATWGYSEDNTIKDNIFITSYNSTLQDSITSSVVIEDASSVQDYRLLGNYYDGNIHIPLSGQYGSSTSKESVWLKGYAGYIPTDWPKDWITVDAARTYLNENDPVVSDREIGWELLNFGNTGLTAGDEHEQVYWDYNTTKSSRALVLPTGFRYYDLDGYRVTSGTLAAWESRVLIKTADLPLPDFSSVSFTGTAEISEPQSGTATWDNSEVTNSQGTHIYQWYICSANDIKTRKAISGANSLSYTPTGTDGFTGTQYLVLGAIAIAQAGGNTTLLRGIEKFSTLTLIQSASITVVGKVIMNGDIGDIAGVNIPPSFAYYSNFLVGVNATRGYSTNYAHSPTRSLYLSSTASGVVTLRGNSFATATQLYSGISYRLGFWYYLPSTENYTGNIEVKTVGPFNGTQTWVSDALVTNAWTYVTCDLDYYGDETQALEIEVTAGGAGEIIYFDDFSMGVMVSSISPTENVTNSDVESGLPNINSVAFGHYKCSTVQSTDVVYSGTYSVKLTNTDPNLALCEWTSPSLSQSGLSTGWYKISMRTYAPGSPNDWKLGDFGIASVASGDAWIRWGLNQYSPEAEWELQEAIVYFDTGHDHLIVGRFYDELVAGGGVCYIDEISVKAVTLPTI